MVNFTARRSSPELVVPARPTPHETKALSVIDDWLRSYMVATEFFRPVDLEPRVDPAEAIKAALAEALVYYYPMAGRLREISGRRLVVDCTEEGVVFVEADANVRLEELGQPLLPPYPCIEELLCDADEHNGVVGKPMVYMQVTRLECGAFVIGLHVCHSIADGFGLFQFMKAIAELSRGEARPSVLPVWEREHIFKARTPPCIRHDIRAGYEAFFSTTSGSSTRRSDEIEDDDVMLSTPPENMVARLLHFGPEEIAALRRHLYPGQSCTTFELLAAFLWRCRTVALGYRVGQRVHLMFPLNARAMSRKIVPKGYYGNAAVHPVVETSVDQLCGHLGRAVEVVQKAKLMRTEEHMRSMVDMTALLRAQLPHFTLERAYLVSDIARLGHDKYDMGWAKRIGGGPAKIGVSNFLTAYKDAAGEETIAASMFLPGPAMERLAIEISMWICKDGYKFIPVSSM